MPFDNYILTQELGFNPEYRIHYVRVYQDVICYWRKKFIEFYHKQKQANLLKDIDRYSAWDLLLYNYNQNDAYVFLYDRKAKCYIQPDFKELENIDKNRLEKQWKGICSVIEEMQLFQADLVLSDGSRKPIGDLLEAGREVNNILAGEVK